MKVGYKYPQGLVSSDCWVKIYDNTLSGAATSITISGLTGNTDLEYKLEGKIIAGADGYISCKVNNDSTANIYGLQEIDGSNASITVSRGALSTGFRMGFVFSGHVLTTETLIFAKTGYVRTAINKSVDSTSVTNDVLYLQGQAYNETSTEITSLVVGGAANCLGIGSQIILWKKAFHT
jgi:hypothetical protein